MKKETLARLLVLLFLLIGISIPLVGRWLSIRSEGKTIELHARMPENGGWSVDTIEARVGEPIHLHMTSDDVVHGFAVGQSDQPGLDILPGEYTDTTLVFDHPGTYTFHCTRWCDRNHWRMRGVIIVTGAGEPVADDTQPLFLKLKLNIDAPHDAHALPAVSPSAQHGAQFAGQLPAYALERNTYLTSSPEQIWQRLRAEKTLSAFSASDLWDAVAWIWQRQSTPEALAQGQKLYAANCAACHGESGKGDGVMVQGLPLWDPAKPMDQSMSGADARVRPQDFSDPRHLLGASPALLEGKTIRGGMGTGMPSWGPILTGQQMDAVIAYLYHFAWRSSAGR